MCGRKSNRSRDRQSFDPDFGRYAWRLWQCTCDQRRRAQSWYQKVGRRREWGQTDQSCCKSALLYYYADHYGVVWKSCSDKKYYGHGTERSGGSDAGRAGNKRLRRIVSCGAVLCQTVYCGKCSAQLFYAQTESRVGGDTFRKARTSACRSAGWKADVSGNPRIF